MTPGNVGTLNIDVAWPLVLSPTFCMKPWLVDYSRLLYEGLTKNQELLIQMVHGLAMLQLLYSIPTVYVEQAYIMGPVSFQFPWMTPFATDHPPLLFYKTNSIRTSRLKVFFFQRLSTDTFFAESENLRKYEIKSVLGNFSLRSFDIRIYGEFSPLSPFSTWPHLSEQCIFGNSWSLIFI